MAFMIRMLDHSNRAGPIIHHIVTYTAQYHPAQTNKTNQIQSILIHFLINWGHLVFQKGGALTWWKARNSKDQHRTVLKQV